MGATVAPAVLVAPDPAQNGGAAKTSATTIRMKVVNQAQATPVQGKEVGAPLVTWMAPDFNRDQDAAGHPVGETSEGISPGMRSQARSCRE